MKEDDQRSVLAIAETDLFVLGLLLITCNKLSVF